MNCKKIKNMIVSLFLTMTVSFSIGGFWTNGVAHASENTQVKDMVNMQPTFRDVLIDTVKNYNGEDRKLRMNVFKPEGSNDKTPVLVFVHGGGWAMGDYQGDDALGKEKDTQNKSGQMASDNASSYMIFKSILNKGIAFVSIDYRLNSEAAFPAQIYDVKGAIRYLRAHAEKFGIDPDRIAISGTSAGAHLAAELATTSDIEELEGNVGGNLEYSSKVLACIDFYGPTDLLTMGPEMDPELQSKEDAAETHDSIRANESILLGFTKEGQGVGVLRELRDKNKVDSPYWDKVKLAELGSPINNVTSDDPPMFIAHGGCDSLVSIEQSKRMVEALNKAGVENIFMSNSKAPHGFQGKYVNDAALNWVADKLKAEK
ncbi:MAG: alpha/beta hydrolase [Clostridium butyricum]|nr:alpha/beta hydrolase [Clostridium butyricum]